MTQPSPSASSPFRLRAWLPAALIALTFGIYSFDLWGALAGGLPTSFDDAYMFARYAGNLLSGHGFVWNVGTSAIYGPTSLPYVFVIAAFLRVSHVEIGRLLPWISWILGALVLVLLSVFAWIETRRSSTAVAALALGSLAWIAATPFFSYHATAGMDTMLSVLATTILSLMWLAAGQRRGSLPVLGLAVCAYVCVAVRPDNGIYAVLFPALGYLAAEATPRWRETALFLLTLGVLLAADTAVKIGVFGDPLPLSFYVKQSGFYEGYRDIWNPIVYLCAFLAGLLPNVLILLTAAGTQHRRLLVIYLVPVALTFFYYFSVIQIMGQLARYYYPALPFVVVPSILLLRDLGAFPSGLAFGRAARKLVLATAGLSLGMLLAVMVGAPLYAQVFSPSTPENTFTPPPGPLPELGWWQSIQGVSSLIKPLPAGTTVAASEVGFIGASAPQIAIIDITGLNDADFAHHGVRAAALLQRQPDIIWLPLSAYTTVWKAIQCTGAFYADYTFYPGAFDYGLAVRKDSPHLAAINASLERVWREFYPSSAPTHIVQSGPPAFCSPGGAASP